MATIFFFTLLSLFLSVWSPPSEAQQAGKVWRLGFLSNSTATEPRFARRLEVLRQTLHKLGYTYGQNMSFEYRHANGKLDQLPRLAKELVDAKIDLIYAMDSNSARAAMRATQTIPIVITTGGDPVGNGLVKTLAQPGGNVTGLTTNSPRLVEKRLGLLKEAVPQLTRVAYLVPTFREMSDTRLWFEEAQGTAKVLGIIFQAIEVNRQKQDFDGAFAEMVKAHIDGLVIEGPPIMNINRKKILQLALKHRIPGIHTGQNWVNDGGLMSYGADLIEPFRRAAVFIDKILRGAKPADLPVEQPIKFQFVINLKTARALNLEIPQTVLFRADKVIR